MKTWNRLFARQPRTAPRWFARSKSDAATHEDDRELMQWLANPSNEREYQLLETVWELSGELKSDPQVNRLNVEPRLSHAQSMTLGRYVPFVAIAASLLLLIISISVLRLSSSEQAYVTGIGEQRVIVLDDGSRMTLNTASTVRVRYSLM